VPRVREEGAGGRSLRWRGHARERSLFEIGGHAVVLTGSLAVADRGQVGNEVALILGRQTEVEHEIEMRHHLIISVVPPVVKVRGVEIGV
jgi:hypothetical protein